MNIKRIITAPTSTLFIFQEPCTEENLAWHLYYLAGSAEYLVKQPLALALGRISGIRQDVVHVYGIHPAALLDTLYLIGY